MRPFPLLFCDTLREGGIFVWEHTKNCVPIVFPIVFQNKWRYNAIYVHFFFREHKEHKKREVSYKKKKLTRVSSCVYIFSVWSYKKLCSLCSCVPKGIFWRPDAIYQGTQSEKIVFPKSKIVFPDMFFKEFIGILTHFYVRNTVGTQEQIVFPK